MIHVAFYSVLDSISFNNFEENDNLESYTIYVDVVLELDVVVFTKKQYY